LAVLVADVADAKRRMKGARIKGLRLVTILIQHDDLGGATKRSSSQRYWG
jgi:hypothetical protein